MARVDNSFALLGDEDGDDVAVLAEHIAKKVDSSAPAPVAAAAVSDKKQLIKSKNQPGNGASGTKLPSKPLPPSEAVRGERGRGRGGRGGHGYSRGGYGGNEVEQFGDGRENGYRRNYGEGANGTPSDDVSAGRGRGRRGGRRRGRGRGGYNNNENVFHNDREGYGGNGNQVEGSGDAGWEHVPQSHGKGYGYETANNVDGDKTFRNGNRNYGGERRGYGGGNCGYRGKRDVMEYGRGEKPNNDEVKENANGAGANAAAAEDNNALEGNAAAVTEEPRDTEGERKKPEEAGEDKPAKKDAEEKKEDENLMTLEEYEKVLAERRKALEALKNEERKVIADKDFDAMQLLDKKKEESSNKPEPVKLKKKDSFEKEEMARKTLSINEFLKPADGEEFIYLRGGGRNRGRGGGFRKNDRNNGGGGFGFTSSDRGGGGGYRSSGYNRGGGSRVRNAPAIQDQSQFPVLGGAPPVVEAA